MSIIGPRPLLVKYLPYYSEVQHRRHEVRPGLSGYAQAHGRNGVSWDDKFAMDVRVTDKKAAQDDADVQAAVKKVTEELGDTGRILVRESGTEPVVRVMVEAESEEICQKYVDMVVNVIKENGYVAG